MKDVPPAAAEEHAGDGWLPPAQFAEFQVVRPLGRGGMGHVYFALDTSLDRSVALKFIASDSDDPSSEAARRERFMVEARAIARLQHPNVAAVFRVGEVEGRPYIAYEFVPGRSLDQLDKPVPWTGALRIAVGLAHGIAAAHKRGVLHRDIKPGNVMISDGGEIKVVDFGIAKLIDAAPPYWRAALAARGPTLADDAARSLRETMPETVPASSSSAVSEGTVRPERSEPPSRERTRALPTMSELPTLSAPRVSLTRPGSLLGTPQYLPPELWSGLPATTRSDVYALGLVLYELCAGALPIEERELDPAQRSAEARALPPVRTLCPELPELFADVIDRCVRPSAHERFADGSELAEALDRAESIFRTLRLLSSSAEPVRMSDVATLKACFARIAPRADQFTDCFYQTAFAIAPELRPLFPSDLAGLRAKFAGALELTVENLEQPTMLTPLLEDLGRRHVPFGVVPEHFELIRRALLVALAQFDEHAWSDALQACWLRALSYVEEAMGRGMALERARSGLAPPSSVGTPAATPSVPPRSGGRTPSEPLPGPDDPPRTRYARNGDVSLAYQLFGNGPQTLLLAMGWVSNIELAWQLPAMAEFQRALARFARVVTFDKRGTGMSDRTSEAATLAQRVDDLRCVLAAAGVSRPVLVGVSDGASVSAAYAARHPDQVRALVICGGAARLVRSDDYPHGHAPAFIEASCAEIHERWGEPLFAELQAPSLAADPLFRDWLARYLRMSASPGGAASMLRSHAALDIRAQLPAIVAPTLLLHARGDALASLEGARSLAREIAAARLVELPGSDHLPFGSDAAQVVREIESFVGALPRV